VVVELLFQCNELHGDTNSRKALQNHRLHS
jgi:hypothetical protein